MDNHDKDDEWMRNQWGKQNPRYPHHKMLFTSLFHHRESKVYNRWLMRLELNYNSKKLFLVVKNLDGELVDKSIFWNFDTLERECLRKLQNILLAHDVGERVTANGTAKEFRYEFATLYSGFEFRRFLDLMVNGKVQYDHRMDTYTEKSKTPGKLHNRGGAFRMKKGSFYELFDEVTVI